VDDVAREETALSRKVLLTGLAEHGVSIKTKTKVLRVAGGEVVLDEEGTRTVLKADLVVFATGLALNRELSSQLKEAGIPFYEIGDCREVKTIAEAIEAAWSVSIAENRELARVV
jgi:pyruvate/2-oxoglutarate dehydrogenase complex dihydrolipoamide dehydrogenase (E3) component